MSSKPKGLLSYDAFSKTIEESRIRTRSGALITFGCVLTLIFLIISEWSQFNTVVIRPELVVDRDRALKLDLNLDVTFPNLPCEVMSLDIMDVSGELQLDLISYGFTKIRLDSLGNEISQSDMKIGDDENTKDVVDTNYCGPCYGAKDQSDNEGKPQDQKVCCQDCETVKKSYAAIGWAFFDGENVEQCEREGYVARLKSSIANKEGCRVKGTAQLNRINGNLHFAPGASFTSPQKHVHDLSLYNKIDDQEISFKHTINHFSFGPTLSSSLEKSASNPLDGQVKEIGGKHHLYSYFLKIVPTRFEFLNGTVLETNQFSTTHHDRPLFGGRDEDHPNTLHARGGIPGLFFHFEMSAVKVINREQWSDTWGGFLLNVISAIGGIVTVGAVLDKGVYAANKAIKGKKEK